MICQISFKKIVVIAVIAVSCFKISEAQNHNLYNQFNREARKVKGEVDRIRREKERQEREKARREEREEYNNQRKKSTNSSTKEIETANREKPKDRRSDYERGMSNQLTKDSNEVTFLKSMLIFFANNKGFNWHYRYHKNSLNYKVQKRDSNGLPVKVSAKYLVEAKDGTVFKDSSAVVMYIDDGLPYRISYPLDPALPEYKSSYKGDVGELFFNDEQLKKIDYLFDRDTKVVNKAELEKAKKEFDIFLRQFYAKYPKHECNECLKEVELTNQEYVKYSNDIDWHATPKTETVYKYYNQCKKPIYLLGIKKHYTKEKGYFFSDETIKYDPDDEIILFLMVIDPKIDLNMEAGRVQYIKFVSK